MNSTSTDPRARVRKIRSETGGAALEAVFFLPVLIFFFVMAMMVAKGFVMKNATHAASRFVAWHAVKPQSFSSLPSEQEISSLFFKGEEITLSIGEYRSNPSTDRAQQVLEGQEEVLREQVRNASEAREASSRAQEAQAGFESSSGAAEFFEPIRGFLNRVSGDESVSIRYRFEPLGSRPAGGTERRQGIFFSYVLSDTQMESHVYVGTSDYSKGEIGDWDGIIRSGLRSLINIF